MHVRPEPAGSGTAYLPPSTAKSQRVAREGGVGREKERRIKRYAYIEMSEMKRERSSERVEQYEYNTMEKQVNNWREWTSFRFCLSCAGTSFSSEQLTRSHLLLS